MQTNKKVTSRKLTEGGNNLDAMAYMIALFKDLDANEEREQETVRAALRRGMEQAWCDVDRNVKERFLRAFGPTAPPFLAMLEVFCELCDEFVDPSEDHSEDPDAYQAAAYTLTRELLFVSEPDEQGLIPFNDKAFLRCLSRYGLGLMLAPGYLAPTPDLGRLRTKEVYHLCVREACWDAWLAFDGRAESYLGMVWGVHYPQAIEALAKEMSETLATAVNWGDPKAWPESTVYDAALAAARAAYTSLPQEGPGWLDRRILGSIGAYLPLLPPRV
jgi:hypothetical protein